MLQTAPGRSYGFLWRLIREATRSFPDPYLHLGGDEVEHECWKVRGRRAAGLAASTVRLDAGRGPAVRTRTSASQHGCAQVAKPDAAYQATVQTEHPLPHPCVRPQSNPEVQAFMAAQQWGDDYARLEGHYMQQVGGMTTCLWCCIWGCMWLWASWNEMLV